MLPPKKLANTVLLAEDFAPFRAFIRSLLDDTTNFQVVAEVSDGLNAIDKSRHLQPDFVLLDIGLPRLNGLQAAKHIRSLVPSAKIVFLTQETDSDSVNEARRLGASGYVCKLHAAEKLLEALEAVLEGYPFITVARLTGTNGVLCPARPPLCAPDPHNGGQHEDREAGVFSRHGRCPGRT